MRRLFILPRPLRIRFTDSVHAAIVTGLRATGAPEALVIGPTAAPWTFATGGWSRLGGATLVRSVTIATPDSRLAGVLASIDPASIRHASTNGDVVDLAEASGEVLPDALAPGQEEVGIAFASPFLVSDRGGPRKAYLRSLDGVDLSAAFSAGLSRRLGRAVQIEASADRLSVRVEATRPRLVRVRRSGTREVIFPAHAVLMTLSGSTQDLVDAYDAGLGEKTRYGFGCPTVLA